MKILIGPKVCGIRTAYTMELMKTLFEQFPQYFVCDGEPENKDFWTDYWEYGTLLKDNLLYRLDLWYTSNYGEAFRTDEKVHELFRKLGEKGEYKIVEVPDDVEWYLFEGEDGSESIHEKHRIWS